MPLRVDLLTSIRNLLSPGIDYNLLLNIDKKYVLKVLLRGSPDLTTEENEILFKSVQLFIAETSGFLSVYQ